MIKAIIIDDEDDARFVLRNKLESAFPGKFEIIAEADSVRNGIQLLTKEAPDIVFMDIKMRDGTGFDILQNVEKPEFEVVFVTAYDKFALRAFQFSAFGYLMKPIKLSDLKKVIENYIQKNKSNRDDTKKQVKVLIDNFGGDQKVMKLVISNMEGFKVLKIKDIIRLEGSGNYTDFVLAGGKKETSSKNLGQYEKLLSDYGFFRIHQSTIINLSHVEEFVKGGGGQVEMSDGQKIKLSRYRKAEFIRQFIQ